MEETKHTPGPWRIIREKYLGTTIQDEEGNVIATPNFLVKIPYRAEMQANAELIAQAPDLLTKVSEQEKELASLRSKNKHLLEERDVNQRWYTKEYVDQISNLNTEYGREIAKLKAERQELVEALGKRIDSLKNDAKLSFYVRFEINFLQSLLSKFPEVPSTP